MPAQPVGSQLAAALSGGRAPLNLPPANFGGALPLASMMGANAMNGGAQATSSTPNLVWNPNNPTGTDTLGGNTANQGSWAGNAAASYLPGYGGGVPQTPGLAPGMPSSGAPGQMGALGQMYQGMLGGGG